MLKDVIYDSERGLKNEEGGVDLLHPGLRKGKRVLAKSELAETREKAVRNWTTYQHTIRESDKDWVVLDEQVDQMKRELLKKNGFNL